MTKPLTPEQIAAIRAVPILAEMPNRLRVALAVAEVRQSEVAEAIGMTRAMLSELVNGRYTNLHVETAHKLATYFGCQIEDLFPAREAVA